LVLPQEIYEVVRGELERRGGVVRDVYARVFMKLGELLAGDFFMEYIKKGEWDVSTIWVMRQADSGAGNIMMLSEGRPLVDNVFSLYDGVLRLELDRPTYEKCGLQGRPIEDGGKKHQKARWGA
jgi:ribonuclease P/MRP protein subunit RPP40